MRGHGGATFLDVNDGSHWEDGPPNSSKIQGLIKEDKLGEKGYKFYHRNSPVNEAVQTKRGCFLSRQLHPRV